MPDGIPTQTSAAPADDLPAPAPREAIALASHAEHPTSAPSTMPHPPAPPAPPATPPRPPRPDFLKPPPIVPRRSSGRRRWAGRLLVLFFMALVMGGTLVVFGLSRVPSFKSGYIDLDLDGELYEESPSVVFGDAPLTSHEVLRSLKEGATQERVKGLILRISSSPGGLARLQALRLGVEEFKKSGKPVIAFMESAGLGGYYLATAADEVVMVPTGSLDVMGIAAEAGFMRGTLDKLGVTPDFYHAGKYKSFAEQYTETQMSEPAREAMASMLDDIYAQLVDDIARARKLSSDEVRALVDRGPFTAEEALAARLIDKVAYRDEVDSAHGVTGKHDGMGVRDLVGKAAPGISLSTPPIALVYGTGQIVTGNSQEDPLFGGKALGSDTLREILTELRGEASVKCVVLRVDSPGGSALASEIIWREIELLQQAGKQVIVSMGDVAASGGYYISCGADVILAEKGTLTGSIGVVTGKFAMSGLYDKLGYTTELLNRGKNAAMYSSTHPFNESEREVLVRHMDATYKVFVERVAEGRGMSFDQVHEIAQGRVWTGNQALENGLVDELGGLDRAIAVAKEKAGIPADQKVPIAVYPRQKTLFERLIEENRTSVIAREIEALPVAVREGLRTARLAALLERESVLALMPYHLAIR